MAVRASFSDGLPKAELHLHIEGTLEPELMFELAARNDVELPYASLDELKAAYRFRNLQEFLDLYFQGAKVLIGEQDFHDLTWAYMERIAKENVLHTEIFFDPQVHTARGVPFSRVIGGIQRALGEAREAFGVTSKIIMCFLRHLDEEDAMRTLESALDYRESIVAVGLDSSEAGHPPAKFKNVFERARQEGFLAVAHAGEEGPAEYVREAVDVLHVERIDHGIHSLDDEQLVERLAREKIPLTVCPLSNVKLGVVKDMNSHPLRKMMEKGLFITVNSDDPAYFGGYLNDNYRMAQEALSLSDRQMHAIAGNSFRASFLERDEKEALLARLDDYAARY